MNPANKIIHKGLVGPEGEIGLLCTMEHFDPLTDYTVMSKWLHDEITCTECRSQLNVPDETSRGSLLRDNIAIRLNIIFQFIDANYWNREVREPDDEKINPDPDGELSAMFLNATSEFDELMRPLLESMEKHDGQYGWPDQL